MKKEFLNFQVSKEAMNELRGGVVAACKCSNVAEVFILVGDTMFDIQDDADQWCGAHNYECVKV